jgi:para-nitrobenzyl esterase
MKWWIAAGGLAFSTVACGSSTGAAQHDDAGSRDAASHDAGSHDGGSDTMHAVSHDGGARDGGAEESGASPDATSDAPSACPTVHPAPGPLLGTSSGATCAYEGIPYAAPPTGALRWKAPQPAASWTTPRASQLAQGCPQGASNFGVASTVEDCLYLNVWTPSVHPAAPLPVMVFVHGGSFEFGSGSYPLYDGTNLATTTGNVVVTINYRLGALGFLSAPELRAEDPAHPSSGNYGLEDQAAAFAWVKANIAAFGGDASSVTIFGESAGGTSMLAHLASPKSAGLFERVIIESAYAPNGEGAGPQADADMVGASFATALGCSGSTLLTCLRGVAVSDIVSESDSLVTNYAFSWFPVVDDFVLPDFPVKLITSGSFNKVPTLLGTNKNEATVLLLTSPPTDEASYQAAAELTFPGNGAAVVAQYPVASYGGSYTTAAAVALTDGAFVCPARQIARAITAAGTPAFRYDFVHAISFPIPNLGAFHGSELEFVFGNPFDAFTSLQPDELPLSKNMMQYWGAMAKGASPTVTGQLAWPVYTMATEPDMVLDLTLSTETELEQAQCDFWAGLP